MMKTTYFKVRMKVWGKIVRFSRQNSWYPLIYKSYWHAKWSYKSDKTVSEHYLSARPHPGAGIGHQLANWIAGYWFAKQFELSFAHTPFSTEAWDSFLGFGNLEKKVSDLKREGYKLVRLPLFDEDKQSEIIRVKRIINSYVGNKVVFVCEQDQFYRDQFGVIEEIQQKFYESPIRKHEELEYSSDYCNVGIHVRRGDIVAGQEDNNTNTNLQMRWQSNDYFEKVLDEVLEKIETSKPIAIYLFSQGEEKDFIPFKKYENLTFCLDMNVKSTFLHMTKADVLITSKSSFSYKPALLNKGIKVVPANFWHGYPETKDWIKADEEGVIIEKEKFNF